jgi:glycerol kinase
MRQPSAGYIISIPDRSRPSHAVGCRKNTAELSKNWSLDREFRPAISPRDRADRIAQWQRAVERCQGWLA